MNPEIKSQWLTALRSGDYVKGMSVLHRSTTDAEGNVIDRFCCLGVLCDLAVKAGVIQRQLIGKPGRGLYDYLPNASDPYGEGDRNYLPLEVRDWANLDSHSPKVVLSPNTLSDAEDVEDAVSDTEDESTASLAMLNDTAYDEFGPIADLIESQL